MLLGIFVGLALAPVLAVFAFVGIRSPQRTLVPLYAALVPLGSSMSLPIGVPPPYNTMSTVVGVAGMGGLAIYLAAGRRSAPRLLPAVPVALLFLGVCGLTYVWSIEQEATTQEVALLLGLVILYALTAILPFEQRDAARMEVAIVAGAVPAALLGLYLLLFGDLPTTDHTGTRFGTAGGELGDPNITAALFVLPLMVASGRALRAYGRARLPWGTAACLIVAAIVLTGSRGGLLAALVGLVVLALNQRSRRSVSVFAAVVVAVSAIVYTLAPQDVQDRVFARHSSGRTTIWALGSHACRLYCLTGSGWGTFSEVYAQTIETSAAGTGIQQTKDAHNAWLRAAVETSFVGLALVVWLVVATARELMRLPRDARGSALAGLAGLLVSNTFLSTLTFKYFWLVFTYAAVVSLAYGTLAGTPAVRTSRNGSPSRAGIAGEI